MVPGIHVEFTRARYCSRWRAAVEMILDQWQPQDREPPLRDGKDLRWEEEDWMDDDATAHFELKFA